jgi:enamine deaminase RidA (YjgF/YER057c/UK114 family)
MSISFRLGCAARHVGGQDDADADGQAVGTTLAEQTQQAVRKLATVLGAEGGGLDDVVRWAITVADGRPPGEWFAALRQVWTRAGSSASPRSWPRRRASRPPGGRCSDVPQPGASTRASGAGCP